MKHLPAIRGATLAAAAVALVSSLPAQAQFGGLMGAFGRKTTTDTAPQTAEACPNGKKKSVGASIMGSMAKSAAGRIGGKFASFVPLPEFASIITGAIACQLDNKEQKQAADATLAATRGDEATGEVKVGDSAEWVSGSRKDVKGRSTIVAIEDSAPGLGIDAGKGQGGKGNAGGKSNAGGNGKGQGQQLASASKCITVSDVVIVNGEETTANKRMCKAPGQARYTLMA